MPGLTFSNEQISRDEVIVNIVLSSALVALATKHDYNALREQG